MTVAQSMPTAIERRWRENFIVTLKRVMELLETEEDEDEYGILKPTDYAFMTVMNLVLEAGSLMGSNFPRGSACPDDEGGITITWTSQEPERNLVLFCPCNREKRAYIFHRSSNEHSTEYEVSPSTLVNWLQWFKKA